ncbi:MAG: T9SS type A sorting domain-containing protein [Bacteroidota bacterium]|nr:T9SS type A sorting domain-containing protein [Bacteroidota bacterium]MDP4236222.1 T9SS type A sorting domain-containing protein [Bacteroidota bacterium]
MVEYKEQYDTLKLYIDHCAYEINSRKAFSILDNDVQEYAPNDTTRFDAYREWLISVLYLNKTDPFYFCTCLESIAHTYQYGKFAVPNAWFAVMKYVIDHTPCGDTALRSYYILQLDDRHSKWLEGDTTKPEDTTLPSLDKIGLGFLLNSDVQSPYSELWSQNLASFTSSPNPFMKETALQFTLSRMTYITIAVYDELGRLVWGDGRGASLETGMHTIAIDGKNLPHGTLYARISTGFGEVRTVKLVHE